MPDSCHRMISGRNRGDQLDTSDLPLVVDNSSLDFHSGLSSPSMWSCHFTGSQEYFKTQHQHMEGSNPKYTPSSTALPGWGHPCSTQLSLSGFPVGARVPTCNQNLCSPDPSQASSDSSEDPYSGDTGFSPPLSAQEESWTTNGRLPSAWPLSSSPNIAGDDQTIHSSCSQDTFILPPSHNFDQNQMQHGQQHYNGPFFVTTQPSAFYPSSHPAYDQSFVGTNSYPMYYPAPLPEDMQGTTDLTSPALEFSQSLAHLQGGHLQPKLDLDTGFSGSEVSYPTGSQSAMSETDAETDDLDTEQARKHPLYTEAVPRDDGLYICPFAGERDCTHDPTKLKCNYDKFVDSHLKPYRCKAPECQGLKFSSTACRLRHEREAHGSHGHGVKPYLCSYPDCERSKPGNGFPRSWNRNDHMKRVHDHHSPAPVEVKTTPTSTTSKASPVTPAASTPIPPRVSRKRVAEDSERGDSSKRQKHSADQSSSNSSATTVQEPRIGEQELLNLQNHWRQQYTAVHKRIHSIRGPLDLLACNKLQEEATALNSMARQLTHLAQLTGSGPGRVPVTN